MLMDVWIALILFFLVAQAFVGGAFFVSSVYENEKRATLFSAIQFMIMAVVLVAYLTLMKLGFFKSTAGIGILAAGTAGLAFAGHYLVRRSVPNPRALKGAGGLVVGEVRRQDERTTVFARNRSLKPGSEQYRKFYERYPQYEEYDARRRLSGGISGPPGRIDSPHEIPNVAAAQAQQVIATSLSEPEKIKPETPPYFKEKKPDMTPEEATLRVKGFARHVGADMVGIAALNPLWVYSHRGEIFNENWDDWGREIEVDHKYVVVIATEMSFSMIAASPHTPTSIESNTQYAKGAVISTQLAAYIANLGYRATANHFRHYESLMVPLAVDAGLGELSRMGYLLTKEYGPRVRLAAVTTDMPLVADSPVDLGVEDFCRVCKKCAVCCPSKSIPMDDQPIEDNGLLRWKLNAETCFKYWGAIGTGCNICMRVCPWSHARTFPHRLIVELVSRNENSRRLFTLMDDVFYGKKPRARKAPEWTRHTAT